MPDDLGCYDEQIREAIRARKRKRVSQIDLNPFFDKMRVQKGEFVRRNGLLVDNKGRCPHGIPASYCTPCEDGAREERRGLQHTTQQMSTHNRTALSDRLSQFFSTTPPYSSYNTRPR